MYRPRYTPSHTVWHDADRLMEAIQAAEKFLIRQQSSSGFWRDYDLEPGQALGWITACVGLCLVSAPFNPQYHGPIRSAAGALHGIAADFGWGYNLQTATDADTTSWALRFLARIDSIGALSPARMLKRYMLENGSVRTFLNPAVFGAWAQPHEDVTPILGLALIETGADAEPVEHIRRAVIAAWDKKQSWTAFWWEDNAYAWAGNLEFLAASGGIPDRIAKAGGRFIETRRPDNNAFNCAQVVYAAVLLEKVLTESAVDHIERLLSMQHKDGGWPPSKGLRAPPQQTGLDRGGVFSDQNRLMSTTVAVAALKKAVTRTDR